MLSFRKVGQGQGLGLLINGCSPLDLASLNLGFFISDTETTTSGGCATVVWILDQVRCTVQLSISHTLVWLTPHKAMSLHTGPEEGEVAVSGCACSRR